MPAATIMLGVVVVAPVPAVLAPVVLALAPALVVVIVIPGRAAVPLVAAEPLAPDGAVELVPLVVMPGTIVPVLVSSLGGALEQAATLAITVVSRKAYSRLDMVLSPTRFLPGLDKGHAPSFRP
ncbi:MAG TPA: hypothetical protein VFN67_18545 [Polyangiales bacterium]|nr:hypothetical protein [Polyangiales bacterium]